ncbi:MAG: hypothetical protein HY208_04365 [Nitrospirae bacterium]|nr:hypothetical protein [Nitrospirota bacterium]
MAGVLDAKTKALLVLESRLINYTGSYHPIEYSRYLFEQVEQVRKSPHPERILDADEHKTFSSLVVDHLGGERRAGRERRGRRPAKGISTRAGGDRRRFFTPE